MNKFLKIWLSAFLAFSVMPAQKAKTKTENKKIIYSIFYPSYVFYAPYIYTPAIREDGIKVDVERDIFGGAYVSIRSRGGRFTYRKYILPYFLIIKEKGEEEKKEKEAKEEKEKFLNEEESDKVIEEWLNKKNLLHVMNPTEKFADAVIVNGKQIPYEREFSVDARVFQEESGEYKYILYWSEEDEKQKERKNSLQKIAKKAGFRVLVYDNGYSEFLGDNIKSAYTKNIFFVFPKSTKKDLEKRLEEIFPPAVL